MKNDFISVGPPQLFGDRIDRPIGLDLGQKGDFENLLKKGLDKKEQKVESALGGINRKVPEDRNGFKEKAESKEKQDKVIEPEKEKEKRKNKISETGVEMSASNTMVSVESSLEVGSLESDFVNTNPDQKLKNEAVNDFAALQAMVASAPTNEESVAADATTISNEAPGLDQMVLNQTPVEMDGETNANLDLALPQQQNLNPVQSDFEKSIQDQLMRDQKDLTATPPIEELPNHESRMDSFENLVPTQEAGAPANQNSVTTVESKQSMELATLQNPQNSTNEFSGKSEQDSAGQEQSGSDQSVVASEQQPDGRQLHLHRDSDFKVQLGAAAAGPSLGKESAGLSTADRSEIVKQAQVLVNDGGGTAKIQLQSEELGSIDLHVRLAHGKVQIEVGSNDPAVKAAIEDSLSDLKSSLAQHNFDLDHVKIKGVSGASEQFSLQSNQSGGGNQSSGMQNQGDASGSRNGFASQSGDGSRHQSHRETQMRELGSMYRQNQTQTTDRSEMIQPMSIGRGISRYQKNDSVAKEARSAWVA